MLNKEEINEAIEAFDGSTISSTLEEYLIHIASTGITLLQWAKIKPLVALKIEFVLTEWQTKDPMDSKLKKANMENISFEEMKERLLNALNALTGIPFTIQRICEMLTDKNVLRQYKMIDKYMRGLEKNLLIVTSVDPLGNRVVNESKLLLNGDGSPTDINTYSSSSHENGSSSFHCPIISTTSTTPSSSWYTSLANVVDSPSSYPNWKHIRDDTTEFEPPTKMTRYDNDVAHDSVNKDIAEHFDAPENQDTNCGLTTKNDIDSLEGVTEDGSNTENVVLEVAPLLKQLLNCERVEAATDCDSTDVAEDDQENPAYKDTIVNLNLVEIINVKSDQLQATEHTPHSSDTAIHPTIDSTDVNKNNENINNYSIANVSLTEIGPKVSDSSSGDGMQVEDDYVSVEHHEDATITSRINSDMSSSELVDHEQNMDIN